MTAAFAFALASVFKDAPGSIRGGSVGPPADEGPPRRFGFTGPFGFEDAHGGVEGVSGEFFLVGVCRRGRRAVVRQVNRAFFL